MYKVKKGSEIYMGTEEKGRVIQSIQRAVNIIQCFTDEEYFLTLNQISRKLELHINTTRGIVNTLLANDMLDYDWITGCYSLGSLFVAKGQMMEKRNEKYVEVAKPYMRLITDKYLITATFQVVRNEEIHTIAIKNSEKMYYKTNVELYQPLPYYASASGKLHLFYNILKDNPNYLEELEELDFIPYTKRTCRSQSSLKKELDFIKEKGYGEENQEMGSNVSGVAVPIFNGKGRMIASISGWGMDEIVEKNKRKIVADLQKAAKEIEKKIRAGAVENK